jgi:hypothetical protein
MIQIFEFIYYCLYRMFALIKRVGEKDEILASSFFSILLTTNTIIFLFPLKFLIPKGIFTPHPYDILIKLILGSVFGIWYLICNNYLLKRENYLRIVSFYESKYEGRNNQMALIGVLYSLLTFSIFIGLAMWLSST